MARALFNFGLAGVHLARVLFTFGLVGLHVARALSNFGLVAMHLAWVFLIFRSCIVYFWLGWFTFG